MEACVSIVTVTYGDRWHLLRQVLNFAETSAKVQRIIVVDNGAHVPIASLIKDADLRKPIAISTGRNRGSAVGFKLGLERVAPFNPEWVWLLDDDNFPNPLALDTLLQEATGLDQSSRQRDAFVAFRPEAQPDIAAGVDVRKCYPARSSFCRFHVADIPYKIWRRLRRRNSSAVELAARVSVPYSTYSGLFLHRTLLDRIGTPNVELVLYCDDTEFTHRIVQSGGHIWLLTDASLTDLERSWNAKAASRSSFAGWLQRGADFQVFYGARNRAFFDTSCWMRSRLMYRINRTTYLLLLRVFALRHRRGDRYRLFYRAIVLGEKGHLGNVADYPLP